MSIKKTLKTVIAKFKKAKLLVAMLFCMLLVESCLGFIMPYLESNGITGEKFNNIADLKGTYNRVILGDSRSHQGINPKVLDKGSHYSTYNLAAPGMQTPFFYYILSRWIKEKGVPDQVVLNISFYMLGGMQWMEDIYFSYYTPTLEEACDSYINMLNYKAKDAATWYIKTRIPSLRYNKRIRGLLDKDYQSLRTEMIELQDQRLRILEEEYRGYFSRGTTHIDKEQLSESTYSTTIHNGYSIYIKYLERFFELSNQYDFDIYIYEFPWPEQYRESENFNEVYSFYTQMIRDVAEQYPHVHMLSNELYYPLENFVDTLHLNDYGATILSKELGTLLND